MNDTQRKNYEETLECDFSFEIQGLARFRVNAFKQNRGARRRVPDDSLEDPDPRAARTARRSSPSSAIKPRGLVLVTGPTGSGKSTTLAAMIDSHQRERVRPHPHRRGPDRVRPRIQEVPGQPARGRAAHAARSPTRCARALREDPDVILVGEMRDLETIRLALTAAETGHLVFGTLHTSSAAKTVDRIVDVFPADRAGDGPHDALGVADRRDLADAAARPRTAHGRVAAHEIMVGTRRDPEPDPREQDRADVLVDPDRQRTSACRRSTRTSPTWCAATSCRPPRRAPRRSSRKTSLAEPRKGTTWNATRHRNSSTTCCG